MSKNELTLIQKQKIFVKLVANLINYAYQMGYELTFGETYRPIQIAEVYERQNKGIKNSLHGLRLAIDLNLFKNNLLVTDTMGYEELGIYWESLSTDDCTACWGGRFNDGNHFSIEHNGVK